MNRGTSVLTIERADGLSTRVILHEFKLSGYVMLGLFSSNFFLLFIGRLRARHAAVADDGLRIPNEARVAMKVNFSVLFDVPFGVEEKILREQ